MAPDAPVTTSRLRAAGDALYRAAGIEVEHHAAEVAGLRTHWVTAGHADSPQAVLLHGSGGSAALWYPALAALAERRRVIAVDMPGHGETSIPAWPSPGTMERMLEWLAEFLDRFDWPLLIGPENADSISAPPLITNQVETSWLLTTSPRWCASSSFFCDGSSERS